MNTLRGAVLWLGPAMLAAFLCTAVLHLMSGGELTDWRSALSMALVTLFFTVGGSALLTLVYSSIGFLPSGARYLVLVVVGVIAGGAFMLLALAGSLMLAGMAYGATTACLWAGFHAMLFGRSDRSDHSQGSRPAA